MNRVECAYASQHFLAFLRQVGPIEAEWVMNTVLKALVELPSNHDHVAWAAAALEESLKELDELAPAASIEPAEGDGEALLAEASTPAAPAKKPGKAN